MRILPRFTVPKETHSMSPVDASQPAAAVAPLDSPLVCVGSGDCGVSDRGCSG